MSDEAGCPVESENTLKSRKICFSVLAFVFPFHQTNSQ
jgi:hypothetical protein